MGPKAEAISTVLSFSSELSWAVPMKGPHILGLPLKHNKDMTIHYACIIRPVMAG